MFGFAVLASAYVAFLAFNAYVLRLDWVLIGVAQELVTIPVILATAAAFGFAVHHVRANRTPVNIASVLLLLVLNAFIWGSVFFDGSLSGP